VLFARLRIKDAVNRFKGVVQGWAAQID
jgi:hypothetical protein